MNIPFVKIKLADIIILLFAIAVTVFYTWFSAGSGDDTAGLIVESASERYVFPLDETTVHRIQGPLGDTVIQVANGEASIIESPCRDKICISAGKLRQDGDWSACLPNSVLIRISGGQNYENSDLDVLSY
jgi:hypothetical protein